MTLDKLTTQELALRTALMTAALKVAIDHLPAKRREKVLGIIRILGGKPPRRLPENVVAIRQPSEDTLQAIAMAEEIAAMAEGF